MAAMVVDKFDDGTKCRFIENTANDGGGAIYVTIFGVMRIYHADINNNTANLSGAGGCHVTSGSVVDIYRSFLENNIGVRGAAVYNRNSRTDVRESVVKNNSAKERGGAFYALCCDDSGGKHKRTGRLFWVYPESPPNPTILIVMMSKVLGNDAPVGGAIEVFRDANRKTDPYMDVADKVLKVDIVNTDVLGNVAKITDVSLGLVGGVALTGTDEAALNRPSFNRIMYRSNLLKAFSWRMGPYERWPDAPAFTRRSAVDHIVRCMLWNGITDGQLADDYPQGSTFKGNKGFQASASKRIMPRHLIKGANIVAGWQYPNGLF